MLGGTYVYLLCWKIGPLSRLGMSEITPKLGDIMAGNYPHRDQFFPPHDQPPVSFISDSVSHVTPPRELQVGVQVLSYLL